MNSWMIVVASTFSYQLNDGIVPPIRYPVAWIEIVDFWFCAWKMMSARLLHISDDPIKFAKIILHQYFEKVAN